MKILLILTFIDQRVIMNRLILYRSVKTLFWYTSKHKTSYQFQLSKIKDRGSVWIFNSWVRKFDQKVKGLEFHKKLLNPHSFLRIDGFDNPLLKTDGFVRTHQTHANRASERHMIMVNLFSSILIL